jgi:sugar phosphate isomerase/epimerase
MASNSARVSRRDFLKLTGSAAAISVFSPVAARSAPLWTPKVGMQLYVVRQDLPGNPAGVFSQIAKMGYQGVEFENWHGRPPAEWRKLLDAHGLLAAGNHIVLNDLVGDKLQKTVDDNAAIGNKFLIVRSLGRALLSPKDNFMRTLEQFNQIAENLEPYGMRVGFHNHAEMFSLMDGTWMWNIMADHTRADVVLQLDTGNAQGKLGGVDIVQVLQRNPGRVDTMHVKPFSTEKRGAFIGDDQLKWPEIVAQTRKDGIEWYVIEYEVPGIPPLEAMKANLDAFRKFYPA